MARYYFNIYDKGITIDEDGQELADLGTVRKMAMSALPRIAADEIPDDGDRRNFVVVVRDRGDRIVYTATLSYVGITFGDTFRRLE